MVSIWGSLVFCCHTFQLMQHICVFLVLGAFTESSDGFVWTLTIDCGHLIVVSVGNADTHGRRFGNMIKPSNVFHFVR